MQMGCILKTGDGWLVKKIKDKKEKNPQAEHCAQRNPHQELRRSKKLAEPVGFWSRYQRNLFLAAWERATALRTSSLIQLERVKPFLALCTLAVRTRAGGRKTLVREGDFFFRERIDPIEVAHTLRNTQASVG